MRIWSLHPKYLDAKGLVALWRETLLAKHVLEEKTKGYRNHPQLTRFKKEKNPAGCISSYLLIIFNEATERGYSFDRDKVGRPAKIKEMKVTKGQLDYEVKHLLAKLKRRDPEKYALLKKEKKVKSHPLFRIVKGDVEAWEVVQKKSET